MKTTARLLRHTVAFAAGISISMNATAASDSAKNRPNIIFILSDDLSYRDLSCYGQ